MSHGQGQITPWCCFPGVGLEAGMGRGLGVLLEQLLFTIQGAFHLSAWVMFQTSSVTLPFSLAM